MDINARDAVGMLGHDPGQHGHVEFEEAMGNPVHHDGVNPRIAEDDFVVALGGRIAVVGGLHVRCQDAANFGDGFKNLQGFDLAGFVALAAGLVVSQAVVADVVGDLFGEPVIQHGYGLTQIVFHVGRVHRLL